MSDSGTLYIAMLEIEQRKLSRNSNGHYISLGCPIREHNISRRSKLNNGSPREIRMVISFHTDVRFGDIIYWDARNWTTEALEEFECHNISLGCPIREHNISRRSKLNNRSSRQILVVITFHTDVQFGKIIYRDARNWTTEALDKFEWS